jgi:hypothetical protein
VFFNNFFDLFNQKIGKVLDFLSCEISTIFPISDPKKKSIYLTSIFPLRKPNHNQLEKGLEADPGFSKKSIVVPVSNMRPVPICFQFLHNLELVVPITIN